MELRAFPGFWCQRTRFTGLDDHDDKTHGTEVIPARDNTSSIGEQPVGLRASPRVSPRLLLPLEYEADFFTDFFRALLL